MKSASGLFLCLMFVAPMSIGSQDERFSTAQQQLRDGNIVAAEQAFNSLLEQYPANVDYIFGHAISLTRLNRVDEALAQLDKAIELAPDYEDVWRTKYDLLSGRRSESEIVNFRELSSAKFPSSKWWQKPSPQPTYPWMVTLGSGIDSLDNNLPNWDNQFMELRYARNDSQTYLMHLSRDARGNVSDLSTGAGVEWSSGRWLAGGSMAISNSADIMPETGINLYTGRLFNDGWATTLRYRYRAYESATVSGATVSTEKYFADFRIAYDLGVSRLHGASSFANHVIVGNWFYRDHSSIGISFTTGREAEPIGGGQVLETDVRGFSLNGRHQLKERVGLQWWLGVHDQGDLYRRHFIGMAVSIRI